MVRFLAYITGTFFYAGRVPYAPGTAGSLAALAPFLLLAYLLSDQAFSLVLAGGVILFVGAGIPAASFIEKAEGKKDARIIVIDEAAGQWITFLFIPGSVITGHPWIAATGFVLFRFFDIIKPFPAKQAEKLGGGTGVVIDDVFAGLYACMALNLIIRFVIA
jgi:phosphatidylglycerophosphatase A